MIDVRKYLMIPGLTAAIAAASYAGYLDSASALYATGARDYDSMALFRAIDVAVACPVSKSLDKFAADLIVGQANWRLQLIAYCRNDRAGIERYGMRAQKALDQADKHSTGAYEIWQCRAFVYLLMADLGGIRFGAVYGPKIAQARDAMNRLRPLAFESRLVTAVSALTAPSFAGGNVRKGMDSLQALSREFPDSIEVNMQLASGYIMLKRTDDAWRELAAVLARNPRHLLALVTQRNIRQ
jgi:hypothetical protein